MTYGEIYQEIISTIYGDTKPPDSIYTKLHGSNGFIAKYRKRLMEKEDLWFFEKERNIYVAEGVTEYDLHFGFKKEIGFRFSHPITGDYFKPLIKLSIEEIGNSFQDYDQEILIPTHYYIDFNSTSQYSRLNLFPIPQEYTDTVDLSTGTTAEQFVNTAFKYVIDGDDYEKAAASNTFSAGDTINVGTAAGIFYGVWLIQINSSGTISTKPGGGLSDQVYTSELNAINALPQVDSGNWPVGYVTVAANTGASWTANTDDLIEGSDAYVVNYYNVTSLLYARYWAFLNDLSDDGDTFDVYEDDISINCADLLIWACIKQMETIRRDWQAVTNAQQNMTLEYDSVTRKNYQYRDAGTGRIPYRNL